MTKPGIKLMADYQCWPLWHHGGREVGNIDPATLGLSDGLAAKLERWAKLFDAGLNWNDPASSTWTKEEHDQFETEGRRLCRELAKEVGDRYAIFYSSQCIPAEALDDQRA